MSNITEFPRTGREEPTLPTYFDYEFVLKREEGETEPTVLNDYGFLICNGVFYAVCRGPIGNSELMTTVNVDDVRYVRSIGTHTTNRTLDA